MEVFQLDPQTTPDFEAAIFDKLSSFFNTGTLNLKPIFDETDEEERENSTVPAPEDGERVEENWIFVLSLPDLSDHIYWAIVDREGKLPAYNYGFN